MFLQFLAAKFKLVKQLRSLKFTECFMSPPCLCKSLSCIVCALLSIIFEEKAEIQDQYPLGLNPVQKADDPKSGS